MNLELYRKEAMMKLIKSKNHFKRAFNLIPWGTQTRAKSPEILMQTYKGTSPLYFKKAKGPYLWDVDGNRFIDYRASLGPIILGYSYHQVDKAVKRQIDAGIIYSMPSEKELDLAQLLVEIIPSAEMIRFLKTGAAAVNAAVRIARAYTGREIILSQGYHGWEDIFMAADKSSNRGIPNCLSKQIHTFNYNDLQHAARIMKSKGNKVACIIVNPFNGFEKPSKEYLGGLLDLANKYGALLIFDEVKTGFRLALGGAQEKYGITPHLSVFAKAMANGYPISAVVGSRKIMQILNDKALPQTVITNTLAGELIGITAAIETIKILKKPSSYKRLYKTGRMLMDGLNDIFNRYNLEGEVQGEPTFFNTNIAGISRKRKETLQTIFICELLKQGIFCLGDWLITLSHSEEVIEQTLSYVDKAAKNTRRKY